MQSQTYSALDQAEKAAKLAVREQIEIAKSEKRERIKEKQSKKKKNVDASK